jgi:hypothetical protein
MNGAQEVKPSWGYVAGQTLKRFRGEFQVYFPPAFLTSLVAYLGFYLLQWIQGRLLVWQPFSGVMESEGFAIVRYVYWLGRTTFIWSMQLGLVWLALAFMLAAAGLRILSEIQLTDTPIAIGKAFQLARTRRLGALVGVSGLAGVITAVFNMILLPLLLRPFLLMLASLQLFRYYLVFYDWATAVFTLVFVALLAKITLAIPELVEDNNVSIGQAIRNSIRATAGWEVFFFVEFGIFGLVGWPAYSVGKILLAASWADGHLSSTGYRIALVAFTILLASLALALLAIVHSVLYLSLKYGTTPPLVKKADSCL